MYSVESTRRANISYAVVYARTADAGHTTHCSSLRLLALDPQVDDISQVSYCVFTPTFIYSHDFVATRRRRSVCARILAACLTCSE